MTSLQISRSRAVRPYADQQQADQLITACRLDGDRNLIFVAAEQLGWPRERPTGRCASRNLARKLPRYGAASTDSHDLHHHHEPARRDLIKPFPPFPGRLRLAPADRRLDR